MKHRISTTLIIALILVVTTAISYGLALAGEPQAVWLWYGIPWCGLLGVC